MYMGLAIHKMIVSLKKKKSKMLIINSDAMCERNLHL